MSRLTKALAGNERLKSEIQLYQMDKDEFERDRILSLITEHAQRYSTGSQGRIALETLALEIRERG